MIIATAGWSIPRDCASELPKRGTHLERYARRLAGAEINTSFYRPHSRETYARWADATPESFRFAVKLPQRITHDDRLRRARRPLVEFLAQVAGLGHRLGPLLVQLPGSATFERAVVGRFFDLLRSLHDGPVACEPRHASWFSDSAEELLRRHQIARVAADPAVVPTAAEPGGAADLAYFRWHGSPRKYWSLYEHAQLAGLLASVRTLPAGTSVWCVFDNTASGGALRNALELRRLYGRGKRRPSN